MQTYCGCATHRPARAAIRLPCHAPTTSNVCRVCARALVCGCTRATPCAPACTDQIHVQRACSCARTTASGRKLGHPSVSSWGDNYECKQYRYQVSTQAFRRMGSTRNGGYLTAHDTHTYATVKQPAAVIAAARRRLQTAALLAALPPGRPRRPPLAARPCWSPETPC